MKKWILLIQLILLSSLAFSQITKADSLALELERQKVFQKVERHEEVVDGLEREETIKKVEQHEELVKRIKWTSPWFLIPTIIAVLGFGWTVLLYFWGIQKRVDKTVKNENTKLIIKNQIDTYFKQKADEERKQQLAEEQRLKAKTVYLVFHPEIDQKPLNEYLEKIHGFTGLKCVTIKESINPKTGDIILFVNETGELAFGDIADFGKPFANRVKFFYYNTNNLRWNNETLKMAQYANNRETLIPRLLELLKA